MIYFIVYQSFYIEKYTKALFSPKSVKTLLFYFIYHAITISFYDKYDNLTAIFHWLYPIQLFTNINNYNLQINNYLYLSDY